MKTFVFDVFAEDWEVVTNHPLLGNRERVKRKVNNENITCKNVPQWYNRK